MVKNLILAIYFDKIRVCFLKVGMKINLNNLCMKITGINLKIHLKKLFLKLLNAVLKNFIHLFLNTSNKSLKIGKISKI